MRAISFETFSICDVKNIHHRAENIQCYKKCSREKRRVWILKLMEKKTQRLFFSWKEEYYCYIFNMLCNIHARFQIAFLFCILCNLRLCQIICKIFFFLVKFPLIFATKHPKLNKFPHTHTNGNYDFTTNKCSLRLRLLKSSSNNVLFSQCPLQN